eukprot:CAMPEP_0175887182 /NCGR_PEP_ID=MMETSP0107_2-20121207/46029_1 /TAXON_ID=195067 ORGANISM="Goniomonas pacifica, Strain CCMP1869" /NCGR_SAMPLE_ID=MMETSP0107_2 /ASSEMBLY_ACC=CAM_ASM_000203 /LENGTH=38 /DNA_ID= /DNA_START= /DNA_END= /DNA_ORIENTATION=
MDRMPSPRAKPTNPAEHASVIERMTATPRTAMAKNVKP